MQKAKAKSQGNLDSSSVLSETSEFIHLRSQDKYHFGYSCANNVV
jgi:hypothetical protein